MTCRPNFVKKGYLLAGVTVVCIPVTDKPSGPISRSSSMAEELFNVVRRRSDPTETLRFKRRCKRLQKKVDIVLLRCNWVSAIYTCCKLDPSILSLVCEIGIT